MSRSHIIRRIAFTALAAAFVLVVAVPGQADSSARPDDRAIRGHSALNTGAPGEPVRPDDRANRTIAPTAGQAAARPDDRAFRGVGVLIAAPVRPDDRADRSLPTIAVEALPTTADGFDWTDASIGAAGAFGLVLLVAGGSLVGLHLRRAPVLP